MTINRNIYSQVTPAELKLTNDFTWRGLSLTGRAHPLTGDMVYIDDIESIKTAIKIIVLTAINERPFSSSDIGTSIREKLFDLMTSGVDIEIREIITSKLVRYEPRIFIRGVEVINYPTKHAVDIRVIFSVKGTGVNSNVTIFLERV